MSSKRLVCLCNHVSADEILKILRAGALSTSDVQKFTLAGTGCTRCVREIEDIVEKYFVTRKMDPQLRIKFE
jgi:bacterioferritin-associated ferredoxin